MTIQIEAQPDDGCVLVFDGTVLELFGHSDSHRFHVWQRPRLEFPAGKRPRLEIRCAVGPYLSMAYEPIRRPELDALAAAVAAAVAQRDASVSAPE
ncbi:MAG: hypothetical protein HOU81_01745 [Hamadaea sp.]|uniref:hypothetical protein n=1 Tax=Hamadaea sp. TaxID=2024425 RepID=UPI0017FD85F0|nr:hypothetical protein [Hamadaea sp.]NUR69523.1 hypothetical protein [Hamadaea sp.]NUT20759.1 hypothetical protein [Hamadaea sp.]